MFDDVHARAGADTFLPPLDAHARERRPGQIVLAELAGPASALRTRGMLLAVKHEAEAATRQVTPR